jgi:hypothetical protein
VTSDKFPLNHIGTACDGIANTIVSVNDQKIVEQCKSIIELFKPKITLLELPDLRLRAFVSKCLQEGGKSREAAYILANAKLDTEYYNDQEDQGAREDGALCEGA